MRLFRGLTRLAGFVLDPDTYCLIWLALRNRFRRAPTAVGSPREKGAKAGNSL